ncbi:MAG TPA: hypothetical protein VGD64_15815 [Acidisarcina sp.]
MATLLGIKAAISDYNFQSQYQQSPIAREGGLIKRNWLRYYAPSDRPDKFSLVTQSWDTANNSGEFNDYSVCTTWGCFNDRFYLLDVLRRRLDYPDLRKTVIAQRKKHRPFKGRDRRQVFRHVIDSGSSLGRHLQHRAIQADSWQRQDHAPRCAVSEV